MLWIFYLIQISRQKYVKIQSLLIYVEFCILYIGDAFIPLLFSCYSLENKDTVEWSRQNVARWDAQPRPKVKNGPNSAGVKRRRSLSIPWPDWATVDLYNARRTRKCEEQNVYT